MMDGSAMAMTATSPDARPRFWKTLRVPVLASLFIQLAVAPFTSVPGDVAVWWQTAERAMAGIGLYSQTGFSYPPLYGYWCMFLGGVAHLVGLHASALGGIDPSIHLNGLAGSFIVTTPIFTLLFKLPMIAADCFAGYYIWRIALRLGGDGRNATRRARYAFYWWAFNPIVIVESAVHGQIDAIAACAIAAAVFYAIEDRWALAGVAVALGVAVKVTPVYLIAPLLGYAIARGQKRWGYVTAFVAGGIATGAVVLGPLLGVGLIENVFTRVAVGTAVGGLGLTGLTSLPSLHSISQWLGTHAAGFTQMSTAVTVAASLAIGVWCARIRSEVSFTKACLVAMAVPLILAPVVNPQYLLWLIPLLALGAGGAFGRRTRWYRGALLLLAVGGIGYLIALFGWADLLAPSSAAFGWPSAPTIMSGWTSLAHGLQPSWLPATLGARIALASTCAVLVGAGLATVGLFDHHTPGSVSRTPVVQWPSGRKRRTALALVASLAVLIEVAALVTPVVISDPVITALSRQAPGHSQIVVSGRDIRVTAFPISSRPPVRRVLEYWSPTHPDSGATTATVLGTTQALQNLLKTSPVTTLDARQLVGALRKTSDAAGTLLLDATGALPSTVWGSGHSTLLTSWIRAGGIFASAGNIPGYYAASAGPMTVTRHGKVELAPTAAVFWPNPLLPASVISGSTNWLAPPYSQSSLWQQALGLDYAYGETPVSTKAIAADGGVSLGLLGRTGDTSEAFAPLGEGGVLVFAGVDQAGSVAHDVARLIQFDWFAQIGPPTTGKPLSGTTVLNVAVPRAAIGVEVVAFSTNSEADWTWSRRFR